MKLFAPYHPSFQILTPEAARWMLKKRESETPMRRMVRCLSQDWRLHGDKYGASKPWWM